MFLEIDCQNIGTYVKKINARNADDSAYVSAMSERADAGRLHYKSAELNTNLILHRHPILNPFLCLT